jgi:hypothetical protein
MLFVAVLYHHDGVLTLDSSAAALRGKDYMPAPGSSLKLVLLPILFHS